MIEPNISLQGLRILITRPKQQAQALSAAIQQAGAQTILLPSIEITTPTAQQYQSLNVIIAQLDQFDIAIFISPNAVIQTIPLLLKRWDPLPNTLTLGAIGPGTVASLQHWQLPVKLCPKEYYNSDALLSLPELQRLTGKRIVIFCGENGRDELATRLSQRGATVTTGIAYRRVIPRNLSVIQVLEDWQRNGIDVIISTSCQGLSNLFTLLGTVGKPYLINTPIVGISDAMADLAKKLGCCYPLVMAKNATNTAILETLKRWKDAVDDRNAS